jgi:Holliday junction resolvasome RuvABC endonuclease subunit
MPRIKQHVIVAGLDLSLTGTGISVIDARSWECDIACVSSVRIGEKLKGSNADADHEARVRRLVMIANEVVAFLAGEHVTHVFVENYSFAMQHSAHQLGEIGGTVKSTIWRELGIVAKPISNTTARKLFLGRGTGKGIKEEVARRLRELGWRRSVDEGDAFVIANYGLSELGFPALSIG